MKPFNKRIVDRIMRNYPLINEVVFGLNDVFGYACADSESLDISDFMDLCPYLEKWGDEAVHAVFSIKLGIEPNFELRTPNFYEIKRELLSKMEQDQDFLYCTCLELSDKGKGIK